MINTASTPYCYDITLQEILYSEMEHGGGYENDVQEFDDGDLRKGSMEMVVTDVVEPLDIDENGAASGDDQDLDFIDEDMTD